MIDGQELLQQLISFLREKGYPEDSLVVNVSADADFGPDLVILDPKSKERLAIFEIKADKSPVTPSILEAFLKEHASRLGDPSLTLYLAVLDPKDLHRMAIYQAFPKARPVQIPQNNFPTYSALRAARFSAKKDDTAKEQKETTDSFKTACFWLGILGVFVLIADVLLQSLFSFTLLTPNRLVLIGIVVGLFVLPYAAKFKALGIEYERFTGKKNDS